MKLQRLFCGPGNHEWTRSPQRGHPLACPEHRDLKTKNTTFESLIAKQRVEKLDQTLKSNKNREPLAIIRLSTQEIAYLQGLLEKQSEPMAAQILRRM